MVVHEPRHRPQRRLPRLAPLHLLHGGVPLKGILQDDLSRVGSVEDALELLGDLKVHRVSVLVLPRGVHVARAHPVGLLPLFGGHFAVEQRGGQVGQVDVVSGDAHGDLVVVGDGADFGEALSVPLFGQLGEPRGIVVRVLELISALEHEDVLGADVVAVEGGLARHAAPHDRVVGQRAESLEFDALPRVDDLSGRFRQGEH